MFASTSVFVRLQVCTETSNMVQCMNELLQLYMSDVQPRLQLSSTQAVYVALDKCSDVVHITDQNLNIQVNMLLCINLILFASYFSPFKRVPYSVKLFVGLYVCSQVTFQQQLK